VKEIGALDRKLKERDTLIVQLKRDVVDEAAKTMARLKAEESPNKVITGKDKSSSFSTNYSMGDT